MAATQKTLKTIINVHGSGMHALAASVVIRAVFDANAGDTEADMWLETEGRLLMGALGLLVPLEAIRGRPRDTKKRWVTGRQGRKQKEPKG